MIRLDHKFDVISIKGILFVNNLKLLEKSFGFHDIIKRKAEENIKKIEFENIIEEFVKPPSPSNNPIAYASIFN